MLKSLNSECLSFNFFYNLTSMLAYDYHGWFQNESKLKSKGQLFRDLFCFSLLHRKKSGKWKFIWKEEVSFSYNWKSIHGLVSEDPSSVLVHWYLHSKGELSLELSSSSRASTFKYPLMFTILWLFRQERGLIKN